MTYYVHKCSCGVLTNAERCGECEEQYQEQLDMQFLRRLRLAMEEPKDAETKDILADK